MKESTIYVPASVATEIDDIHQEHAPDTDPKWRTVRRAVRQLAFRKDTNE